MFVVGKAMLLLLILFCSTTSNAVEIIPLEESSPIDQINCFGIKSQMCISNVCITSEQRDCSDRCRKLAEQSCVSDY